jgi:hypothetical protein
MFFMFFYVFYVSMFAYMNRVRWLRHKTSSKNIVRYPTLVESLYCKGVLDMYCMENLFFASWQICPFGLSFPSLFQKRGKFAPYFSPLIYNSIYI